MKPCPTRHLFAAAALAACAAGPAAAQDAPDIAQVKATTQKLINLLVEQGVLTRSRAEALLAEIDRPAPAAAARPASPPAGAAPAAPAPVRVPYVPEFVRKELKEEIRNEVMAQGLLSGWAVPGSVPEWTRGVKVEGDVRARYQFDRFDDENAAAVSVTDTNRNRATTLLNTTEDRQRLRVRARLGVTATLDDQWGGGIRLTTGSTTDPISSNQTLGTYGNRFTAAFDRAYVRWRDGDFNAVAGRFGNPWFGTDLVWANDLGFDGIAAQWTPSFGPRLRLFGTAALMPVQEVELSRSDKWLSGVQVGAEFPAPAGGVRGKLGLGLYRYHNLVGQLNAAGSSLNDFTAPAFAQKGNTYYNISSDPARPLLALASEYRLVNLTGVLEVPLAGGRVLSFTGDLVRNTGFDRAAVSARVGTDVEAQTKGWLLRAVFGQTEVARRGDWQVSLGYKRVERDAVLDAFTDSDLRLGGTDAKGFTVGGTLGLGRNSTLGVRYLSGDSVSGAPLSVDVLQIDLSARF